MADTSHDYNRLVYKPAGIFGLTDELLVTRARHLHVFEKKDASADHSDHTSHFALELAH